MARRGHVVKGYQPQDQGFLPIAYVDAGGSHYFDWGSKWNQNELIHPKMHQRRLCRGNAGEKTDAAYLTDDLTLQVTGFLRRSVKESKHPFFLYFCHFAVHAPLESWDDYKKHLETKSSKGWNAHCNPTYAGMVKSLDDSVGAILHTLGEIGVPLVQPWTSV